MEWSTLLSPRRERESSEKYRSSDLRVNLKKITTGS